jgi:hypothetical protein
MKIIVQMVSVIGALISVLYLYIKGWDFAAVTTLLSFVGLFAGSFFLFIPAKEVGRNVQKVGKNSTAYQAGGDMHIGGKRDIKD